MAATSEGNLTNLDDGISIFQGCSHVCALPVDGDNTVLYLQHVNVCVCVCVCVCVRARQVCARARACVCVREQGWSTVEVEGSGERLSKHRGPAASREGN